MVVATQQLKQWRAIPGFEGRLWANADGEILGVKGIRKITRHYAGYCFVRLWSERRVRNLLVHRLVALAFLGSCPRGLTVNHKNGVKHDNRPENLEYVTHKRQIAHARELKGEWAPHGEKHYGAKLRNADVVRIKELRQDGLTFEHIGRLFGVRGNTVSRIVSGKRRRRG